MQFVDLYQIHERRAEDGLLTVHPSRWLYAGRKGGGVFDIFTSEDEAVQVGSRIITHFKGLAAVGFGGRYRQRHGYYFANAPVAERYCQLSVSSAGSECAVRDMLALQDTNAEIEVNTPVGRVDLLLPGAIVEVKTVAGWKDALGQVLAYSWYYPGRNKVIHLIGNMDHPDLTEPIRICNHYGVVLRYQCILQSDASEPPRLGTLLTANPSFKRTRLRRSA